MNSRSLLYWMTSVLTLLICLLLPTSQSETDTKGPANISSLMKVEPKYISYYDNQFHALLSGHLKIAIKTEHIQGKLTDYDLIHIKGLTTDHNSRISLRWKIDNQQFAVPLTLNSNSLTPINFKSNEQDTIQDLHLLLQSDFELNNNLTLAKTVSFNAIYLEQQSHYNPTTLGISQWFGFKPVEVNSINGYTDLATLNLQSLIWRIILWLTTCIITYFVTQVNGTHLLISIALAWLIVAIPFSVNFTHQHQQLTTAYADNKQFINKLDKNIHQLAQSIKATIKSLERDSIETDQFIILGPNKFEYLRLFYHLSELNVALYAGVTATANQNLIYILTQDYLTNCDQENNDFMTDNQLKVMAKYPDYCLAEPL